MRSRALVAAFFGVSMGTFGLFALACSQGSGTAQDPGGSSAADGPGPTVAGAGAPATSTAAAAVTGAATGSSSAATGEVPGAECKDLVVDITNEPPDGGVAMSNAMTAGDAGSSDRLTPVMDVMTKNRDKFRCCFNLWGKNNLGKEARVTLAIKLKASGELETFGFKPDETDITDPGVERCMQNVAASLSFPASPSGKETRYNQRYVFRAKAK
jgi:hypothetical protein